MSAEQRARELLLTPQDHAAYIRLMSGDRGDYCVYCPACLERIETYETDILRHVRTCEDLRKDAQ